MTRPGPLDPSLEGPGRMKQVQDAEVSQVKFLKNKDPRVRSRAAENLARLGPQAKFAIFPLSQRLRDADANVRCRAATALGEIGAPAVSALVRALSHADKYVQREAAWALSQIGPDACVAIPKLNAILKFSTVNSCCDHFKKISAHQETEVMFVHPGPDATLRAYAARALGKIGAEARSAIPALRAALADPDGKVAQAAAQALNQIQEETGSGWYL